MTGIADGTIIHRPGGVQGICVAWLARDLEFTRGATSKGLVDDLRLLAARPRNVERGLHYCEFCGAESPLISRSELGEPVVQGTGEIWVESEDGVFIAPTLLIHYVEEHHYVPPLVFIDAVAKAAAARRAEHHRPGTRSSSK